MFSKLFIIGVILTVTYGLPKVVKVSSDHSNSLNSEEKEKTNKGCKIANCDVCNVNKKICISCSVGWGRNAVGTCSACGANCNLCTLDFKVCTECSTPTVYKLIGGQCKKCELSNCQICNDDLTKCNLCVAKYGLNIENKCQACENPYCELCNSDFKKCEICNSDFKINSEGQCFQGGQCLFEDKRYCLNEYGIDPLYPIICRKCAVANCFHCNDDYKFCNVCDEGFRLDANNKCIECAITNCSNCLTDENICQVCKGGFDLEQNQCLKNRIENCYYYDSRRKDCWCNDGFYFDYLKKQCQEGFTNCFIQFDIAYCSLCSAGFVYQNSICTNCSIENCANCEYGSRCIKCMPGFYYEDNTCKEYCINCNVLSTNMTCSHMTPGYGRLLELDNIFNTCFRGCKFCFHSFFYCLVCLDGFKLVGTDCIGI